MNRKLSLDSAIFIAGFTAVLYTWSTAYYNGYLGFLRLDADVMERSFHQVIYDGLLISIVPILTILIFSAAILYLYSHVGLPFYVDWIRSSLRAKRKVIKFRRFWFGKRNSPPVEQHAKTIFTKISVLAVLGVLYIFSLSYFEIDGKENAQIIIESHVNGKNKQTQMIKTQINGMPKSLKFLGCGARNCAGIEEQTNLIYYFSITSGYSYLYKEPIVAK